MLKIRGFEIISKEQFDKDFYNADTQYQNLKPPKRATAKSAGYDVLLPFDIHLEPNDDIKIPTGIKAYMLDDEVLFALPRSGYGFKYYIRLANTEGVVDCDYYNNPDNEGHIWIKIRNEGDKVFSIKKGEAFCQFIFQKYLLADGDDFTGNSRTGGIGSTNEKKN